MNMRDVDSNLCWDDLDYLFDIDVNLGTIKWKNPSGNRANFLRGKEAGCFVHRLGYVVIYINRKIL